MRGTIESRVLRENEMFKITGYVVEDHDSSPDDADCYDEVSKIAFNLDEWRFVGLVVTVTMKGHELGEASLWAVEWGTFRYECTDPHTIIDTTVPGGRRTANVGETVTVELDPLSDYYLVNDLIHEALANAQATVHELMSTLPWFASFTRHVQESIKPVSLAKATD